MVILQINNILFFSETANTLGAIFYNVIQVTCFQERSPCSAHQRYEDFFYRTSQCPIEFRSADLYVPPNAGNLIEKILAHPYGLVQKFYGPESAAGRSLQEENNLPAFKQFTRRLGVKLASVGLAAVSIFREIIQSPRSVWDSLHAPTSKDLPEDIRANDIAGGYYYNMPARQQNARAHSGGAGGGYYYQNSASSRNYWLR